MKPPSHLPGTIIATFGRARLVKQLNGTYELVGGTPEDREDAWKWIETFMPEARVDR
jgi:hypothetical protein